MMWEYILKVAVLLPLVCGLMIGCLYLWRRLETRLQATQGERMLTVKETMMLSPGWMRSPPMPRRSGRTEPSAWSTTISERSACGRVPPADRM